MNLGDTISMTTTLADAIEYEEKILEVFPSGSTMLNLAIGKQDPKTGDFGFPSGDIAEIFGLNQTGKTLIAETVAQAVQARNPKYKVLVISSEPPNVKRMAQYMDPKRTMLWSFKSLSEKDFSAGVFTTAEKGLDVALTTVLHDMDCKLVILDSVKALVSLRETNDGKDLRSSEDAPLPAYRARMLDQFLLKFNAMNRSNALLLMMNQVSNSIGPEYRGKLHPRTIGGNNKDHLCNLRIEAKSVPVYAGSKNALQDEDPQIGMEVFYRIIKNKHAQTTAQRRANSTFFFSSGFDRGMELFHMGTALGLIETGGGGYYTFSNGDKVRGKENVADFINNNGDLANILYDSIVAKRDELFGASKGKIQARKAIK